MFTIRNSSCGKVMFLQASVILSTWGDGRVACMAGGMYGRGYAWQGYMHGRGACMVGGLHHRGGMCGRGAACVMGVGVAVAGVHSRGVNQGTCMAGACVVEGCTWQERWPLQQMVRILLECILVWKQFQTRMHSSRMHTARVFLHGTPPFTDPPHRPPHDSSAIILKWFRQL